MSSGWSGGRGSADRLRLTSTAEFAGYDWGWTHATSTTSCASPRDVFPDAVDFDRGEYRACLRPMTPDGPARPGVGRYRNLFFKLRPRAHGWDDGVRHGPDPWPTS